MKGNASSAVGIYWPIIPKGGDRQVCLIPCSLFQNNRPNYQERETFPVVGFSVHISEAQTPDMALFFLKSTAPHLLKDAPSGDGYLTKDKAKLDRGKIVFAER